MNLLEELKNLFDQIRGKKNMFGYRSTLANQLYLTFCIMGNIYFTDKIHYSVKCIWFMYDLFSVSIAFPMYLIYIFNENNLNPIVAMNSVYSLTMVALHLIFLPSIICCYRHRIESSIALMDDIVTERITLKIDKPRKTINVKWNLDMLIFFLLLNLFAQVLRIVSDLIQFCERQTMTKGALYPLPVPNVELHNSVYLYLFDNVYFLGITLHVHISVVAYTTFVLYWHAVCYDQLMHICDYLDHETHLMNAYIEETFRACDLWRKMFKNAVINSAKKFIRVNKVIEEARGFYEVFISALVGFSVIVSVNAITLLMYNPLFTVGKLKVICGLSFALWLTYVSCETGQLFESAVSEVSFAIYSTPWYWDVAVRKDMYIFLCQSQVNVNLSFLKVYSFSLATFSKILNFILSAVRFIQLQVVTKK